MGAIDGGGRINLTSSQNDIIFNELAALNLSEMMLEKAALYISSKSLTNQTIT